MVSSKKSIIILISIIVCIFLFLVFNKQKVNKNYDFSPKKESQTEENLKNGTKIVSFCASGLGNQMFQYAFAKSLKLKTKSLIFLEMSSFEKENLKPHEKFFLSHFNIDKIKNINIQSSDLLSTSNFEVIDISNNARHFDKDLLFKKTNVYYKGYFECYKYFDDIRDYLIKDFSLKEELDKKNKKMLKKIKSSNSVCIHIRRGDTVQLRKNKLKNDIGKNYYEKALEIIKNKEKNLCLFIFSDDISWCKENINFLEEYRKNNKLIFVDCNTVETTHYELELMKNCKHQVIADSTFSWWAAYLNTNPNKIVVAPKGYWMINKSLTHEGIVLPEWELVNIDKT